MTYRLTRRCEQDIIGTHRHGGRLFGLTLMPIDTKTVWRQFLTCFRRIRKLPERSIAKRRVRLHPYRAHVIIYRESQDGILIIRVLHVRQDWRRHLR